MINLLRTAVWFIYFWLFLIITAPLLLVADIIKAQGKDESYKKFVISVTRCWTNSLLFVAGVKVEIKNKEVLPKQGAVLYIANHQGNFDIPISISFFPGYIALVSKKEIGNIPIVASWMKRLGCVLIDRDNPRQSMKMLAVAGENIEKGYSVVVFPEGTRSNTTEVGEFKSGAFRLAQKNDCIIVPVAIEGSYKIMSKHGFIIKPAVVTVTFCEPIDSSKLSKDEKKLLPETVKNEIIKAK